MADKSRKTKRVTTRQQKPAPHVKAVYDRKMFEAAVVARAHEDDDVRKALVKDPKAALEKHGVVVAKGTKLKVIEEKANELVLVLPAPLAKSGELTDDQLEEVAGGYVRVYKGGRVT